MLEGTESIQPGGGKKRSPRDMIPIFKYLKSIHVRKKLHILLLQNKGKQISVCEVPLVL